MKQVIFRTSDGTVVNVTRPGGDAAPPAGHTTRDVPDDTPVGPGWTWDDTTRTATPPPVDPDHQAAAIEQQHRENIERHLTQTLDALRAIRDRPRPTITTEAGAIAELDTVSAQVATLAGLAVKLVRLVARRLDGED